MFVTMFAVFVLGYILIAQEHVLKIDKAAIALLLGVAAYSGSKFTPYSGQSLHLIPE